MKHFAVEFSTLEVNYRSDYGIDRRSGWSVAYDGSVLVQFERWLVIALIKAWRLWRTWE